MPCHYLLAVALHPAQQRFCTCQVHLTLTGPCCVAGCSHPQGLVCPSQLLDPFGLLCSWASCMLRLGLPARCPFLLLLTFWSPSFFPSGGPCHTQQSIKLQHSSHYGAWWNKAKSQRIGIRRPVQLHLAFYSLIYFFARWSESRMEVPYISRSVSYRFSVKHLQRSLYFKSNFIKLYFEKR